MKDRTVNDRTRMSVGLVAAAYMRWVETRNGQPPTSEMTQAFISGTLDDEGYRYDVDEPLRIELVALTVQIDVVEAFIKQSGIFGDLDRAANQKEP
jgi:hypothetical protein